MNDREKVIADARDHRAAWNREYAKPDPLWKGPSPPVFEQARGRVLELGCGNGKTAAALVRSAEEVVAVDFSRRGLEACDQTVRASNLALVEADARWLPFASGTFDQVVAFHVLGHLPEEGRRQAVSEILRVLRPGGGLLMKVFSCNDMRYGSGERTEAGTYVKGTGIACHYFDAAELEDLFQNFQTLAQDESRAKKRYHGTDKLRAEWVGSYLKP